LNFENILNTILNNKFNLVGYDNLYLLIFSHIPVTLVELWILHNVVNLGKLDCKFVRLDYLNLYMCKSSQLDLRNVKNIINKKEAIRQLWLSIIKIIYQCFAYNIIVKTLWSHKAFNNLTGTWTHWFDAQRATVDNS